MGKRNNLINLIYRAENFLRKGLRAIGININLMSEEQVVEQAPVTEQAPVVEQTPEAPVEAAPAVETPQV